MSLLSLATVHFVLLASKFMFFLDYWSYLVDVEDGSKEKLANIDRVMLGRYFFLDFIIRRIEDTLYTQKCD